jgi:hypothetical protein
MRPNGRVDATKRAYGKVACPQAEVRFVHRLTRVGEDEQADMSKRADYALRLDYRSGRIKTGLCP